MTTKEIIALAKEKLGKEINEQIARDYLDGKAPLPDEALDIVSGGGECTQKCEKCGNTLYWNVKFDMVECSKCGYMGPAVRRFD